MTNSQQYDRAVQIITAHGKPSLSQLMRQLEINYNAAARLLDQMEQAGVISCVKPDGGRLLLKGHQ